MLPPADMRIFTPPAQSLQTFICALLALLVLGTVAVADETAPNVAPWDARLSAPTFSDRESATRELWEYAAHGSPLLADLVASTDPEVAARAMRIERLHRLHGHPDMNEEQIALISRSLTLDLDERHKQLTSWLNTDNTRCAIAVSILAASALEGREVQSKLEKLINDIGWSVIESPDIAAEILEPRYHPAAAAYLLSSWSRMRHPLINDLAHRLLARTHTTEALSLLCKGSPESVEGFISQVIQRRALIDPQAASDIAQSCLSGLDEDLILLRHLAALHAISPDLEPPHFSRRINAQAYDLIRAQLNGDSDRIRLALAASDELPPTHPTKVAAMISLQDWAGLLNLPKNTLASSPPANNHVRDFIALHQHAGQRNAALARIASSTAKRDPARSFVAAIARHDLDSARTFADRLRNIRLELRLLIDSGNFAAAHELATADGSVAAIATFLSLAHPSPSADQATSLYDHYLGEIEPSSETDASSLAQLHLQWRMLDKFTAAAVADTTNPILISSRLQKHLQSQGWGGWTWQNVHPDPDADAAAKIRLMLEIRDQKTSVDRVLAVARLAAARWPTEANAATALVELLADKRLSLEQIDAVIAGIDFSDFPLSALKRLTRDHGASLGHRFAREWRSRLAAYPAWTTAFIFLAKCEPDRAEAHLYNAEISALADVFELSEILRHARAIGDPALAHRISHKILALAPHRSREASYAADHLATQALKIRDASTAGKFYTRHLLGLIISEEIHAQTDFRTQSSASLAEAYGIVALEHNDLVAAKSWLARCQNFRAMRTTLALAIYEHLKASDAPAADAFFRAQAEHFASLAADFPDIAAFQIARDHWQVSR